MSEQQADQPADGEIVARVRGGDRDAYRVLVRRYEDVLYRHAMRMTGHPDTASDLVQDAFVKAFDRLETCRDPKRFGGWLFRILANGCKDHLKLRRQSNVRLDDLGPSTFVRSGSDPADDLERSELRGVLEGALARLPAGQREAFVLKHVEGRSYREIAERLDASVSALKMRVHRAREAMQEMLEEAR